MSDEIEYEWMSMSEWLEQNKDNIGKSPEEDGWIFVGGALKRPRDDRRE